MRIDAYNQITSLYNTTKSTKAKGSYAAGGKDEVQISKAGHDFQIAKQAVAQSADIRKDKISQLKAKVESGEYNVEPGDFAAKLLEKYNADS